MKPGFLLCLRLVAKESKKNPIMFIGHYGVAFLVKKRVSDIPLWLLFTAVQLPDFLAFSLVLAGMEKASFAPCDNPFLRNHLELPFSHSLAGVLLVSLAAFILCRSMNKKAWAWVLGLCVLSHWVIDLIVHNPDLTIFFGQSKVGLGLWNRPLLTYAVEMALVMTGWLVLKKNVYSYLLLILMIGAFSGMVFREEPAVFRENYMPRTAIVLITNLLFIFIAFLWDRKNRIAVP